MNHIITIGRKFGSDGPETGCRLAEASKIASIDKKDRDMIGISPIHCGAIKQVMICASIRPI